MTASFTLMTNKTIQKLELAGVDAMEVATVLHHHRSWKAGTGDVAKSVRPKQEVVREAVKHMRTNTAMTAVVAVVMNADDSIDCIKIGRRGGVTLLANLMDQRGLAA